MTPFRERDVRQVVHDLLDQTGAFDGVYLSGLPERRGGRTGESRVGLHRARRDHAVRSLGGLGRATRS